VRLSAAMFRSFPEKSGHYNNQIISAIFIPHR
jgi:hypothetical protein